MLKFNEICLFVIFLQNIFIRLKIGIFQRIIQARTALSLNLAPYHELILRRKFLEDNFEYILFNNILFFQVKSVPIVGSRAFVMSNIKYKYIISTFSFPQIIIDRNYKNSRKTKSFFNCF